MSDHSLIKGEIVRRNIKRTDFPIVLPNVVLVVSEAINQIYKMSIKDISSFSNFRS